jgi:PAS domain S-box-containing protein
MKSQPVAVDPVREALPFAPIDSNNLLQSIVDVVCAIDDEGVLRYVSPSCTQLVGYTPEEMTGSSFLRFVHVEDVAKTAALFTERHHGCSTSHFENRCYHKDGSLVHVLWSGRWDEEDRLFYCVARNGAGKHRLEQRLVKAQQMARVASFEFDVVNNCYTHTSDTLFEIFGLDRALHPRLTRELFWSLVHPDDLPTVRQSALQGEETYSPNMEYRIIRPDGRVVYIQRLREVVRDADGRVIKTIGTLQDITDRKLGELALRQSEERLQSLVQRGTDLIAVIDREGVYNFVGANVESHLGYTVSEMVGRNALEFVHPDDAPHLAAALPIAVASETFTAGPYRFRNSRGEWRWVETTVSNHLHTPGIRGLVTNSRDVTDKKLQEDALRLSEQRFKALVYNSTDLIVVIDEEATINYVSDNITAILGYTPAEIIGASAFHYIHPGDTEKVAHQIKALVQDDIKAIGVQHRFRHKNGSWLWMESKGRNQQDNESIGGILVNSRNIHERVKLQKQLSRELMNKQKEITAAAIKAQETERSQLGLKLHDNVNQVLTTVKLYNELYLTGHIQDIELLRKSTSYLQDCINEIRSISKRLSAPTLGAISLKDSIRELVHSVNLTRRLEVRYEPQGIDRCVVSEDVHLSIYRIVQESLNNIIKYAGAHTAVVALTRGDRELCLRVRDNGRGFDTTAKRVGIGITNMRTRAEHLNASFRLFSAPGRGCTIEIRFPFSKDLAVAAGSSDDVSLGEVY